MRQSWSHRPLPGPGNQGATDGAGYQEKSQEKHQGNGSKHDKTVIGGKPLHHLLALRIRVLRGNFVNFVEHAWAIQGECCEKEHEKSGKAEQGHESAHSNALAHAQGAGMKWPIASNDPFQT
jgi:hypothetical protein